MLFVSEGAPLGVLVDVAGKSSVLAKVGSDEMASIVTGVDCEFPEKSGGTATGTATEQCAKFSAPTAMRCRLSVGSDVTEIDGSDSIAPCTSSNRGSV